MAEDIHAHTVALFAGATRRMHSLYVHIPFCERKCAYCDFYSLENTSLKGRFLRALETEIALAPAVAGPCDTVYFGGGTPSLLEPGELSRILDALAARYAISPGAEITLEANPGTVTPATLRAFRERGVNRLSIGVQSLAEEDLRFLGRIHTAGEAAACVADARGAGFTNVSIDLIYSLPGQTPGAWAAVLDQALALAPDHVSAYSLIVEEGTPLARSVASGAVTPNDDETEAALYEHTMAAMRRAGFEHYEVSNYAQPGFRSRHNSAYWTGEAYTGFGPSAHSYAPGSGPQGGIRRANVAALGAYCEALAAGKLPVAMREELTAREAEEERLFLALRSGGLALSALGGSGRIDLARALAAGGSAVLDGKMFRLTDRGYLVCDEIAARMMASADSR